jgi:hypothetical protein
VRTPERGRRLRIDVESTFVALAMTRFQLERIYSCCISDGVPQRSFLVALIVGTILNLNLTKIVLTYAVPYCVATFGAVSYRLRTTQTSGHKLRDSD